MGNNYIPFDFQNQYYCFDCCFGFAYLDFAREPSVQKSFAQTSALKKDPKGYYSYLYIFAVIVKVDKGKMKL